MTNALCGLTSSSEARLGSSEISDWERQLAGFHHTPHVQLEANALHRRVDTTYVVPVHVAMSMLSDLSTDYFVLTAGPSLVAAYRTLYFDTEDLQFFHAHQRGIARRYKVRIRHYPDRRVSFLEVKCRINEMHQGKIRVERAFGHNLLGANDMAIIGEHTDARGNIVPQVWTDFHRITLVGSQTTERITIDFNMNLESDRDAHLLSDIAVIEVKQTACVRCSPATQALRARGCRPRRFSKYCTAIALNFHHIGNNSIASIC
jgi:hypothetical protein